MKIPTDKVLHFILALILAILVSIVIANAIYNLMPNNPGARTATGPPSARPSGQQSTSLATWPLSRQ